MLTDLLCEVYACCVRTGQTRGGETQDRTLKEMSEGGQSQPPEWAMVRILAWKHDIAEGGKTPFYHSVRFSPSLPVKHAICPRHRSSCWLIECDRAIHTLLPIRHYLLQKKNHQHSTVTGCQAEGTNLYRALAERLPIWGGGKGQGLRQTAAIHQHFRHTLSSDTLFSTYFKLYYQNQHPK